MKRLIKNLRALTLLGVRRKGDETTLEQLCSKRVLLR